VRTVPEPPELRALRVSAADGVAWAQSILAYVNDLHLAIGMAAAREEKCAALVEEAKRAVALAKIDTASASAVKVNVGREAKEARAERLEADALLVNVEVILKRSAIGPEGREVCDAVSTYLDKRDPMRGRS